ncbi:hypothetical protein CJA_3732 [Cellvibrio japonicus Ueda107]|uniref:Uncharacterized protein n=1 Tax=Cellvibrio japonicus (strain Ueda107) TaxID=498211 RepID=B3PHZ0_CELJU|nr:hypothetical protein CJA_3732 [Cellvibrio japonicus Ueda107]
MLQIPYLAVELCIRHINVIPLAKGKVQHPSYNGTNGFSGNPFQAK